MPDNLCYPRIHLCLPDKSLYYRVVIFQKQAVRIYDLSIFLIVQNVINHTLEVRTFHDFCYHRRIRFTRLSISIISARQVTNTEAYPSAFAFRAS